MKFRFFFNSKDSRVKFCKDAKNIQKYDFLNSQKIYLKMKFCINSREKKLGEILLVHGGGDWKTKKINKFDSDKVYSFPPNKLRDNRYNIPCDKLCLSFFFFFFFFLIFLRCIELRNMQQGICNFIFETNQSRESFFTYTFNLLILYIIMTKMLSYIRPKCIKFNRSILSRIPIWSSVSSKIHRNIMNDTTWESYIFITQEKKKWI